MTPGNTPLTTPRSSLIVACFAVGPEGRKCLFLRGHSGSHDDGSGDRGCSWSRDEAVITSCRCMAKDGVVVALDRDCETHRLGAS